MSKLQIIHNPIWWNGKVLFLDEQSVQKAIKPTSINIKEATIYTKDVTLKCTFSYEDGIEFFKEAAVHTQVLH